MRHNMGMDSSVVATVVVVSRVVVVLLVALWEIVRQSQARRQDRKTLRNLRVLDRLYTSILDLDRQRRSAEQSADLELVSRIDTLLAICLRDAVAMRKSLASSVQSRGRGPEADAIEYQLSLTRAAERLIGEFRLSQAEDDRE